MKDILQQLEDRRGQARLGGGQKRIDAQHARGQADGAGTDRTAARRRFLRGIRHVRRPSLYRFRDAGRSALGRRGRHRLGHGQRPHGLCVQSGFHRLWRFAVRNARPEDLQDHGHGGAKRRARHRHQRFRWRAHPGRRGIACRLRGRVSAQHHGLWRRAADQPHHGALRGWRGLLPGDDRLHLHGEGHVLHVRHRPRCGEDRDQRDRDRRGTGRRFDPYQEVLRRRRRLRE